MRVVETMSMIQFHVGFKGLQKQQLTSKGKRRGLFIFLLLSSKIFKALCTKKSCQGNHNTETFTIYLNLWWPASVVEKHGSRP